MQVNFSNSFESVAPTSRNCTRPTANAVPTVDASAKAPPWFKGTRVLVDARTYDRFVNWDRSSMRSTQIDHDESLRLAELLQGTSYATLLGGGCFVLRLHDAWDHHASAERAARQIFRLRRVPSTSEGHYWLIEHVEG